MYSFSFTTAMCGFHAYKDVWEPTIGLQLAIDDDGITFNNGPYGSGNSLSSG